MKMIEKKFRAWDKTNNEWYMGGESFDLDFSGSYGNFFFDNDHPLNMRDVVLVWCQFTGLKDKNGKEICEGDILDGSKYPDESCPSSVSFEDGAFRRNYKNWETGLTRPILNSHDISILDDVVIGNIYEHPELLNG